MNYTEKVWVTYDGNDRNNVTSCSDIGGKKLDDRFIHIEGYKIDKVDFYKNNGLEDYISIGLKETPIPVNLYGRVLFGLYYNDETINYERMIEIQENVNTYGKAVHTIIILMLIVFGIPFALVGCCLSAGGLAGGR